MVTIARILGAVLLGGVLSTSASGHGNQHVASQARDEVTYRQDVSGLEAQFVVERIKKVEKDKHTLYACDVAVRFADSAGGAERKVLDAALRFTTGHESFGQAHALIFDPDRGHYAKRLFLHEPGVQHFLLIVVDEDGRKREFHFHHSF